MLARNQRLPQSQHQAELEGGKTSLLVLLFVLELALLLDIELRLLPLFLVAFIFLAYVAHKYLLSYSSLLKIYRRCNFNRETQPPRDAIGATFTGWMLQTSPVQRQHRQARNRCRGPADPSESSP